MAWRDVQPTQRAARPSKPCKPLKRPLIMFAWVPSCGVRPGLPPLTGGGAYSSALNRESEREREIKREKEGEREESGSIKYRNQHGHHVFTRSQSTTPEDSIAISQTRFLEIRFDGR